MEEGDLKCWFDGGKRVVVVRNIHNVYTIAMFGKRIMHV